MFYYLEDRKKLLNILELQNKKEKLTEEFNKFKTEIPTKKFQNKKGDWFERTLLAIDFDYSVDQIKRIFNHGKTNYTIYFMNKGHKLCKINKTFQAHDGTLICELIIDTKRKNTSTYILLDKFLYLVEKGDFKIVNKEFIKYYMQPYKSSKYYIKKNFNFLNTLNNLELEIDKLFIR